MRTGRWTLAQRKGRRLHGCREANRAMLIPNSPLILSPVVQHLLSRDLCKQLLRTVWPHRQPRGYAAHFPHPEGPRGEPSQAGPPGRSSQALRLYCFPSRRVSRDFLQTGQTWENSSWTSRFRCLPASQLLSFGFLHCCRWVVLHDVTLLPRDIPPPATVFPRVSHARSPVVSHHSR